MTYSKTSRIEIATRASALLDTSTPKTCTICGSRAIRAHAISKGKILKKLAENGKVISVYYDILQPTTASFGLVGIGKVSTFSAFCPEHDAALFKSLDEGAFTCDNKEQEFKMTLRSLARADWFNVMLLNSHQRKLDAVATYDIDFIKRYIGMDKIYQSHTLEWIKIRDRAAKEHRDLFEILVTIKQNLNDTKTIFATRTIKLSDTYPIAASGTGILYCSCSAVEPALPKLFSLNIFPEDDGTYAVFSIPTAHEARLDALLNDFPLLGIKDYRIFITHMLTKISTEALAINPSYWSKLTTVQRDTFMESWRKGAFDNSLEPPGQPPALSIFNAGLLR